MGIGSKAKDALLSGRHQKQKIAPITARAFSARLLTLVTAVWLFLFAGPEATRYCAGPPNDLPSGVNAEARPAMPYANRVDVVARTSLPQSTAGARFNSSAVAQSRFDIWTTDNGLPQNSVSSILQTREGYLWFTTNDGLVRYDGVRFTIFNAGNTKGLRSSRLSHLLEDREGNLWIVGEDRSLIRYAMGLFTTFTAQDGLVDDQILRLSCNEDGVLIAETGSGVARWNDGKFVPHVPGVGRPFSGWAFPVQSGATWYLDDSKLHRVERGRVTAVAPANGFSIRDIKTLYEDGKGQLWVGAANRVLMRFKDNKTTFYTPRDGLPPGRVNCMREDLRGNLWIGMAGGGLVRFKDDRFTRYTTADGLTGDDILSIYEDREEILWIGTSSGLNRLRDNVITSYSTANGLAADNTYPIYQDREGAIWIGSWRGLTRYQDGVFTRYGEECGVANELVTALAADRDGGLWIGTLGGGARRCKDGKVVSYLMKDGLPSNVVRAILEDKGGAVWLGTPEGLCRYKDRVFSVYTTKDGLSSDTVNVIFEDSKGDLWIGSQRGLSRYANGRFESYAQQPELSDRVVRSIYEDSEGVLWIGTYDSGLIRLKEGRFTGFATKDGLFNNGVFQILEDARGNFWISCNLGIYRLSKKELNEYAEKMIRSITSIPYGKRDGMLNSECNGGSQPAGIRAGDGRLWFPTQGGIAVVDPDAVPVSRQPPPVVIEDFLIDKKSVPFREGMEIEPSAENFEIHYSALSFIMSEHIGFRYKLEGLDTDWIEAGTRRIAYYSHVPPGGYRFRVIAANRDGIWNLEGASFAVRIIPPFWRTWWFFSIALSAIAGAALLGYKVRIARLEKARRAQESFSEQLISSQENERQRIAAELHDSLGQHLLIIKNSALLGLNSQDGKEQLSDISEIASQAIDEVREISYNLRPYQLDDLGLTRAIEAILAKVAASSEISFSVEIDPIDGLFTGEAEINIYRIVQESLNNIVKHSRAGQAKMRIKSTGQEVEITIQDSGRGFNPNQTSRPVQGGFGLKGISERARILGAKCIIDSAPGRGTTISLKMETNDGRLQRQNKYIDSGRSSDLSQRTERSDRIESRAESSSRGG